MGLKRVDIKSILKNIKQRKMLIQNVVNFCCQLRGINMNKKELIKYVSDESGVTLEDAEIVVSIFLKGLFEAVIKNDRVKIKGFGSFAKSKRKSYDTEDPRGTGRHIHVDERVRIRFIPCKEMKEKLK